jgi:hypothetical protein
LPSREIDCVLDEPYGAVCEENAHSAKVTAPRGEDLGVPASGRIVTRGLCWEIPYIDGIPRPNRLWYEIVRTVAPHLLVPQFKTFEGHYAVTGGWRDLVAALDKHGEGLSLPEGVEHLVEVVTTNERHRLWHHSRGGISPPWSLAIRPQICET